MNFTEWFQFMGSGFFFRFGRGNQILQGAYLSCDGEADVKWCMCTPSSAEKYKDRRWWRLPPDDYLKDLQKIPANLTSNDNYAWALDIIAD
jgi:hypothetical protein